jgi:hypothetical protein
MAIPITRGSGAARPFRDHLDTFRSLTKRNVRFQTQEMRCRRSGMFTSLVTYVLLSNDAEQHQTTTNIERSSPRKTQVTTAIRKQPRQRSGNQRIRGSIPTLAVLMALTPSQCSPPSSARLNPSLVRTETARRVGLAAPRSQRRRDKAWIYVDSRAHTCWCTLAETQRRAAVSHGALFGVIGRAFDTGREASRCRADRSRSRPPEIPAEADAWSQTALLSTSDQHRTRIRAEPPPRPLRTRP